MRALCLSIAATLVFGGSAAAQTEDRCAFDLGAMMSMDFATFDSTLDSGWRMVGDRPGCEAIAADLLAQYRTDKIDEQRRSLMHHEAQLRAASGQTDAAIALIEQVRSMQSAPEMIAYHDAEIAFLRGDLPALNAARDRLLAVPEPEYFTRSIARFRERYPDQPPPVWPLNIETVNGFVACFGRPYMEAYNAPCRRSGN
ncbi:MAG: hypothetical protein NT015_18045 [Alphaproteobacteria bacterium]|nr:hypothetical protein [Alphaproteobacteria bacterium]